MPDFYLDDVTNYPVGKVSLKDFKGKWLFLDFWFTGCTNCIATFPKISEFQKTYTDKAQFLMVALNDLEYNSGIRELFERYRQKYNLQMPCAYDSILAPKWKINKFPYIIIVDPEGVVRHITGGRDMTKKKLEDLFNNRPVSFFNSDAFVEFDGNYIDPDKMLYRSIITKWNGEKQFVYTDIEQAVSLMDDSIMGSGKGMNISMVPLKDLFIYAYYGQWRWDLPQDSLFHIVYPYPILETSRKQYFDYNFTDNVGAGTYNYHLYLPKESRNKQQVMRIMRQDLQNTFGFTVSLEKRKVRVWKLVATDQARKKLPTKGGEYYFSGQGSSGGAAGFTARNYSIDNFLASIFHHMGGEQPPYFNETGITSNIDIEFNALLRDWNGIKKELKRNGLDLVPGDKEMEVLVIRDGDRNRN